MAYGIEVVEEGTIAEIMEELTYLRFFFNAVIDNSLPKGNVAEIINNEYRAQNRIDPPEGY